MVLGQTDIAELLASFSLATIDPSKMPQQIIQDRYIDHKQLQDLLTSKFGLGAYTIKVG